MIECNSDGVLLPPLLALLCIEQLFAYILAYLALALCITCLPTNGASSLLHIDFHFQMASNLPLLLWLAIDGKSKQLLRASHQTPPQQTGPVEF